MSGEWADITGAFDHRTLPANVRIGPDCFVERRDSFARFRSERNPGLVLGEGVLVYTWTTFNVEPSGQIFVGDGAVLVGAVFMCAERIEVGRGVVISYGVTIADSDFHPIDPEERKIDAIANSPRGDKGRRPRYESRPVRIGDGARIGIGAIVLKGVTIGAGARVGAGAVVTADVPPGGAVAGNPARPVAPGGPA